MMHLSIILIFTLPTTALFPSAQCDATMVNTLSPLAVALVGALAVAKKPLSSKEKDVKFIGCDVCSRVVEELYRSAEEARKEAPYNKISEEEIQDMIENVCKADLKGGEWIRELDITTKKTDKGNFLELKAPGGMSKCKEECSAIVESCDNLINDEIDADDLSGIIFKNKLTRKELKSKVCREWSGRCSSKAKPINYERTDIPFEEISEKDLQMEQLMAQMKASGMGGMNMYNKDDMENMMANGGMPGGYGDYDSYGDMGGYGGMPNGYGLDGYDDFEGEL